MSLLARSTGYLSRWSNPVAALMLMSASAAISTNAHADPADFQAMPGLWKITLHTLKDGNQQVKWKCLYDGANPWTTFVDPLQPQAECTRDGEHRTSTALTWQVTCGGHSGNGHIVLDSPQHYSGEVAMDGHASMHVEGQRYAACTGPSD